MKKYILYIISFLFTANLFAQCVDNGNHWNQSWVSCITSQNPNPLRGDTTHWLLFEFQESQYIDTAYFWNANRVGESGWGAKDVIIDYSIDGTSWVELGTYEFPQAPETSNYEGFPGPQFDGLFLKKILITILSTHDEGNCASIAEVQFKIDQTACYGIVDDCGICDGPGAPIWYLDEDGDGLGDSNNAITACSQPPGYVNDNSDLCDNGNLGWLEIAPLFELNGCNACHGNGAAGGLDLRSYATTAAGGNLCGTSLLTGTKLVDIINIPGTDACGTAVSLPSMNARVGNQFDILELAELQAWIDGGAPQSCVDFCTAFTGQETVLLCAGSNYTFPDGTTQNNIVTDLSYVSNLVSVGGCDSLVTTNLNVQPVFEIDEQATLCSGESYIFPDGTTQNNIVADLSYVSNLVSIEGCDSLITTALSVTTIDTTVSVDGPNLTAEAVGISYQWLDCENNFEIIDGATEKTFTAMENGSYAVAITQNSCIDTSGCHTVLVVGIERIEELVYSLRPNPVRETLYITGPFYQNPEVIIYNVWGQICPVAFNKSDLSLDVNNLAAGVYMMKIRVNQEVQALEFVKQW